jgi:putative phage-type endonuclease
MQQQSDEWRQARLGKVTGSRVADVIARTKTGFGASRGNYMAELICERLTGQAAERYSNAAMQWGTDTEPQARASYEFVSGLEVTECGLFDHATIKNFAASPDGLIGADGLVEIKCPNTATHIETLLSGTVDGKYVTQMQAQMACTGRKWCDFVSFDPRMPIDMQMFIARINRDDVFIAAMERDIEAFLSEMLAKIDALNQQYASKAA